MGTSVIREPPHLGALLFALAEPRRAFAEGSRRRADVARARDDGVARGAELLQPLFDRQEVLRRREVLGVLLREERLDFRAGDGGFRRRGELVPPAPRGAERRGSIVQSDVGVELKGVRSG
eukprot:24063-Pelagococcus_subviridis.AAC.1